MKNLISSINRSPLRCGFFTVAIALAWFALSPPLKAADCPTECGAGGNTAVGVNALDSVTTGINNTAVGLNALTDDTSGQYNVAVGSGALANNISGNFNMAIGTEALAQNTANFNLAIGFRVGYLNTTGRHLTGIGAAAMRNNMTGDFNTAIGADALRENTTSSDNVAVGDGALAAYNGTNVGIDGFNTALGSIALTALTEGFQNTAVGRRALESATSGNNNTSVGWRSGDNLLTGNNNTFLGRQAGANYNADESNNIVIGGGNFGVSGDNNAIRIGSNLTSSGINVINNGAAANAITIGTGLASDGITVLETLLGSTIRIGSALTAPNAQTFVGGIFNAVPAAGSHFVVVGANGKLADATVSSRRFKKDVAPIDKISEGILALKPVTFHFKNDDTNYPQFGLIAEDVAEVNPDWITRDPQGEIYGVRYETIPVLLLNEFLKEHKKVEEQQASIAELKSTVAQQQKGMEVLTAQLKEQAAQIQKVSAQLETSKPAPKVVTNR
jgi:hypothetical protein